MNRLSCPRAGVLRAFLFSLLLLVASSLTPVSPGAWAQADAGKAESLRPAVATLLQAAQERINAKDYGEALARIREAEAIADRTPYENFVIAQTRAAAAAGAGDAALILKASEGLVATGRLPPGEQSKMTEAIANTYYRNQNYAKAGEWASRYVKEGGTDPQMRVLLARSLYLNDDFANAATVLRADLDADEKDGRTPPEERVRMLASSYIKLDDAAGYAYVLEKLLVYYPKKEYWPDAVRRLQARPGYSNRLDLDALRLLQATGNLSTAPQYMAMSQLALQAGLPAEAKKALDDGFAAGVLGAGADADRQRKLRDTATRQVAEDDKALAQSAKDANAAKDGNALVNVGFTFVTAGQTDKGIALMEQGIQKGGLKRPDDVLLHLGIAYVRAGQKAKALAAFKAVQGTDGAADLARLWTLYAQKAAG